ncbi:efflux RND transporter periplasmic adaptor subunit [Crenobacter cavernae]|uniref:Efflux RND transporter periplasmic adaptor subunit n=2 Tax=Crenobacter cavernae TaxID=2290923 RepID=A0ABY0FBD6_9NEIS|nr:efflux RND transporter periplasmic adaptor subunit [Crenobacter cavernae]
MLTRTAPMRRIFSRPVMPYLLLAAVVAGLAALGWRLWRGPQVPVVTARYQPVIETVVATGRVSAPAETLLGPTLTARVIEAPIAEGRRVRRGTVLLRLESQEAAAAEAQASANLAAVRAASAEAERQLARQEALYDKGFVSRAAVDSERLRAEQARRQVDAAAAQLAASRSRREQLTIVAPDDGILARRDVEAGDVVNAGRGVLAFVSAGDPEVKLDVDERFLARLAVGQDARVAADAYPREPFAATVSRVGAQVDRDRGTLEVDLALPAPPVWLKSGMTVSAEVIVSRRPRAMLLPSSALVREGSKSGVLLIEGGRLVYRAVEAGDERDGRVEVRAGLAEGARVVVEPEDLAAGQRAHAKDMR